jgi:hypothetical protein
VIIQSEIKLTPEQVAEAFWNLNSKQHADFFAHLDDIAGIDLCFQMAAVVREIQSRSNNGDFRPMNGFTTMLNHAQDYATSANEWRAFDAKQAIRKAVKVAA